MGIRAALRFNRALAPSPMTALALRLPIALALGGLLLRTASADLVVIQRSLTGQTEYTIRRFDERTGTYLGEMNAINEGWTALSLGPDGNTYAAANVLGGLYVHGFAPDGAYVRTMGAGSAASGITFGPDGHLYVAAPLQNWGDYPQGIKKLDGQTNRSLGTFLEGGRGYENALSELTFRPDGRLYALTATGVERFDGQTGAVLGTFVPVGRGGLADPSAMVFGPDGHLYVASASGDSVLKFDGSTGAFLQVFVAPGTGGLDWPSALAFAPDGALCVAGRASNQILRFAPDTGALLGVLVGRAMLDGPYRILFTPGHTSRDVDWFDDALPPGAVGGGTGGDGWNWVTTGTTGPRSAPIAGARAHVSNLADGLHEHFFNFAQPFPVGPGDILYAYIFVDPMNPPREVMLSFNSGRSWEHRAYWGQNLINAGVNGTPSRMQISPHLPSGSQGPEWRRLEIPAAAVGLAGRSVVGLSFTLHGGRATWDRVGRHVPHPDQTPPVVTIVSPAPGNVRGEVVFEATASDASGIRSVQWFVEDTPLEIPATLPPFRATFDFTASGIPEGRTMVFSAEVIDGAGQATIASVTVYPQDTEPPPEETEAPPGVWFDRALPAGAWTGVNRDQPDAWMWRSFGPYAGAGSHGSPQGEFGLHEHYFAGASAGMAVGAGTSVFTYIWIPSDSPPTQIMVSWFDGTWEHRAYWGENRISFGRDGTPSRRYMGPVPATDQWVRLEVPAALVGLEGRTVTGMSFSLYDGSARWSATGVSSGPPPPTAETTVWFDEGFPAGAKPGSTGGDWQWTPGPPAARSGAAALHSTIAAGRHEQFFNFAHQTLALQEGDRFFIHVYLDPANPPRELVLSFCADNWEHRAYWGENLLRYGVDGTPAQFRMGPLPPPGQWVRLEVPAEAVRLQGLSVRGLSLTLYDGRASFDLAGRLRP